MSFPIIFYQSYNERIVVNKTFDSTGMKTYTGSLREGCSITSPSILIEKSEDENVFQYNYAYIEKFNRWYFVDDVISENTHLWRVNMSVDVLMTYRDGIKETNALVSRNENTYDDKINDSIYFTKYNKIVTDNEIVSNFEGNKVNTTFTGYFETQPNSVPHIAVNYLSGDIYSDVSNVQPLFFFNNEINSNMSGISKFSRNVVVSYSQLTSLASELIPNDVYATNFSSINIYPYELNHYDLTYNFVIYDASESSGTKTLDSKYYSLKHEISEYLCVADFDFNSAVGINEYNFTDFEPYTRYELFLPYYGWITINAELCIGRKIAVEYVPDYATGNAVVMVYSYIDETSNQVSDLLFSDQCQLGVHLPINTTNALEANNQRQQIVLNSVLNGLSSVVQMGGGYLQAGTSSSLSGAISGGVNAVQSGVGLSSAIINGVLDYNQVYDTSKCTITSGNSGLYTAQKVRIKTIKLDVANDNTSESFRSIYGKPLNQFKYLKEVTGFTICGDFHLDSSYYRNATLTEMNALDSLLRGGVIL